MKWILTQDGTRLVNLGTIATILAYTEDNPVNTAIKNGITVEITAAEPGLSEVLYTFGVYHDKKQVESILRNIMLDYLNIMPPCICDACRKERGEGDE